jgi:hypothetical protein
VFECNRNSRDPVTGNPKGRTASDDDFDYSLVNPALQCRNRTLSYYAAFHNHHPTTFIPEIHIAIVFIVVVAFLIVLLAMQRL